MGAPKAKRHRMYPMISRSSQHLNLSPPRVLNSFSMLNAIVKRYPCDARKITKVKSLSAKFNFAAETLSVTVSDLMVMYTKSESLKMRYTMQNMRRIYLFFFS